MRTLLLERLEFRDAPSGLDPDANPATPPPTPLLVPPLLLMVPNVLVLQADGSPYLATEGAKKPFLPLIDPTLDPVKPSPLGEPSLWQYLIDPASGGFGK